MRPESFCGVDIGHFLDWDWAWIIEMLEELPGARDLSDLDHDIHIVVLSTRHVEAGLRIPC